MIKVYGHPLSTCTRKVFTTLIENDTPYDFQLVDLMVGEHKQPPHLARQPFGQIPVLEDDGFRLYESRAICRYLDEKVKGKLIPHDLRTKAVMEQWISVETSNFSSHVMKFVFHHILNVPQDAKVLELASAKITEALGVMDTRLANNKHLVGDQFTLADICFMPYFQASMMLPVKDMIAKAPNVSAWWNRVSERPSWIKVSK
jgi:glutathione S-transferase